MAEKDVEQNPDRDSQEVPDEVPEQKEHSTADYAKFAPPKKKKKVSLPKAKFVKPHRKLVIGFVVLLALVAAGAGAYWFLLKDKPADDNQATQEQQQADQQLPDQITVVTKNHDSVNLGLSFDYPEDWTVTDETPGILTVVSPPLSLTDAEGETVTGQVTMTIRNKLQELTEFDSGHASASMASEKITYTNPTPNQRGETYLSFFRFASSSSSTALDGVYITGDNGYEKAQVVAKADFDAVDPIINLTFTKCSDNSCSGEGAPMSLDQEMWTQDTTFRMPLEAMLKSLSIN